MVTVLNISLACAGLTLSASTHIVRIYENGKSLHISLQHHSSRHALFRLSNSRTFFARHPPHTKGCQGRMSRTTFTTWSLRSRKTASMGKLMKKVWMALHLRISIPVPRASPLRPMSPRIRSNSDRATSARTPWSSTVSTHSSTPRPQRGNRRRRDASRSDSPNEATPCGGGR